MLITEKTFYLVPTDSFYRKAKYEAKNGQTKFAEISQEQGSERRLSSENLPKKAALTFFKSLYQFQTFQFY